MFRHTGSSAANTGGRSGARRFVFATALIFLAAGASGIAGQQDDTSVVVSEERGTYIVAAVFTVPQAGSFVRAALTDYAEIPRFMRHVRTSKVIERTDDYTLVEQEAVARFMMFSRRVHLVLEVLEDRGAIRFRDVCGKSFARYDGVWTIAAGDGSTRITYELKAQPSFDVPEFLLKRLLKRDAREMIEQLKAEISSRARTAAGNR